MNEWMNEWMNDDNNDDYDNNDHKMNVISKYYVAVVLLIWDATILWAVVSSFNTTVAVIV